jgi:hypothetical protein
MASLPDQITAEELERRIDRYEEKLDRLPTPGEGPRLRRANGGSVERSALGAAEVGVGGETIENLPEFVPQVELVYEFPDPGHYLLETSPARLLRVGSTWQEENLSRPGWSERRVVKVEGESQRFLFHVAGTSLSVAQPTRDEDGDVESEYEIPPAATAIRGEGLLKYPTGQEVPVSGEQLLKRPGKGGALTTRPGGVYAVFEGSEPAQVRIGNAWIDTTPTN